MHGWVVCLSLQALLAAYETLPRDSHYLLSQLQQLMLQQGGELQPTARETLLAFQGGGKTAKLSKTLLNLTAVKTSVSEKAKLQMVQTRLGRAKRWNETK